MDKGIARRAVLVSLNIGSWGSGKTDHEATKLVHASKHANAGAGRYVKSLIDMSSLRGVKGSQHALREFHYTNTLPWTDSGWRLLPTVNYLEYSAGIDERQRTVNHEVELFLRQYDAQVELSRQRLGDMFNPAEYPDKSELPVRFYSRVSRRPMPTGDDLRLNISADQEEALRIEIDADVRAALNEAMKDPWQRIADILGRTVESLSHYGELEPGAQKSRTFRDSTINNIKELCELLPRLNLTEDEDLQRTIIDLQSKIEGVDPEDLRRNDTQRRQMTADLDHIRAIAACAMTKPRSER